MSAPVVRPKVLVVDDERDNVDLLMRTLRRRYEVLTAVSGEEGLAQLRAHPDLAMVLTDQRMPGMTGVELLREALRLVPMAARVIFTGYTDFQDVLDAINLGQVNRLLLKPVEPEQLAAAVADALSGYFLAQERDELLRQLGQRNRELQESKSELERIVAERTAELAARNADLEKANRQLCEANEKLAELALRDGLTGVFNYRYFQERLAAEVARAQRHERPLGLVFLDIDHFKQLNDTHGHQAGDQVLQDLAALLVQRSRLSDVVVRMEEGPQDRRPAGLPRPEVDPTPQDVVARYGGEEFAIILPETPLEGVRVKAENVRALIADHHFRYEGAEIGRITVSIGIAALQGNALDAASLIRQADRALYKAKDAGRNRVKAWEGEA